MASSVSEAVFDTAFYFVIFFLIIGFMLTHLSFPLKYMGNVVKEPTKYLENDGINNMMGNFRQWGMVSALDGVLAAIALIILIFLKFSLRRLRS